MQKPRVVVVLHLACNYQFERMKKAELRFCFFIGLPLEVTVLQIAIHCSDPIFLGEFLRWQ